MKKIIPLFAFVFICILLLGTFPSVTSACSCAELPSAKEEFERSKAVFSGKVLDINENRSLNGYLSKSVLFEVDETWKGTDQSQIVITTGQGGGDCGIEFKEGEEYLVYANESDMYGEKSLVTIICNRTNQLSSLQEDLKIIGEGHPPQEEIDLTDKKALDQLYIWIPAGIAIGIGLIFEIKRRKKPNQ